MTPAETSTGDILDQIRDDVRRVLDDPLYWFPVRHHSPAAARHIQQVILDRRPELILIEGPSEASGLVPFIVDRATRPPVAIYSSFRDDDNLLGLAGILSPDVDVPARLATWYPLMEYSPEYVAMKMAGKIGADVLFIDLPHFGLIRPRLGEAIPGSETPAGGTPQPSGAPLPLEDDRLLVESDFYRSLADAAGFKSWNEAWDSLFEFGDYNEDAQRFRYELATFCAAARATTSAERIANDGTLQRERFMRRMITQSLDERQCAPDQALVVCGGFHLFMDHNDDEPPPEIPAGTVYTSVVPYSYFQVSELSGYGAGNRAPRFFQTAWELKGGSDDALLSQHVVTTLALTRRQGHAVSSADAISVCQHARMLAALRGRVCPVLDDIHDAVMTCCCKGDPAEEGFYLLRAMDQADIGNKIGAVTDKIGRLPLLSDFYLQLERHRLSEIAGREKQVKVTLDTREPSDRDKSVLLQRLRFMEIPVCQLVTAGNTLASGTIFKEVWRLKWSPKVDAALIEKNIYGDQIESAALAILRESISKDQSHAGRTCGHLRRATEMRLPTMIRDLRDACEASIEQDSRFISLAEAAMHLNVLRGHGGISGEAQDTINRLLVQCFQRACFALPESANLPEDQHADLIDALRTIGELVLRDDGDALDRDLFVQYVENSAAASRDVFLQGAFLGILGELRAIAPQQITDRIAVFARQPPDRMVQAGAFLSGVLSVSRTSILLGADHLVGAVDQLIAAARWDDFLTMLPQLRAAFHRLHARQRSSIALRVARLHGLAESEELTELTTSVAAAAMFARIDAQVDEIMKSWNL